MRITYLGHAGFCAETPEVTIVMDPWLSNTGAFDSAWFQFPCNHHLAGLVRDKLSEPNKAKFIYISHEHKDHYDFAFLNSIESRNFKIIIADFRRPELKHRLADYKCNGLICLKDREKINIDGGIIQIYLDDTEINRDSAILVTAHGNTFLNFNDCRKFDELQNIKFENKDIDVFACQFSGATWHPTCYDYPLNQYQSISRRKVFSKFESVAKAIETLKPLVYLPSAGPPCFLDPMLIHINFEQVNIFPRSGQIISYLTKRLEPNQTLIADIMPGDVLDAPSRTLTKLSESRVDEQNFKKYVHDYSERYKDFFDKRNTQYTNQEKEKILNNLFLELEQKLIHFTLSERIKIPLYFKLSDYDDKMIRVNFVDKQVEYADKAAEKDYYSIKTPSWEIARVLDRKITWDDFSLTFRMRLNREPDMYQKLIEGFLVLEAEDLNSFCEKLLEIESRTERVIVEAGGCRYSVDRYCPHEGGDLSHGWIKDSRFLVCARHGWEFDLTNEGKCTSNHSSINAIPLETE